MECNNNDKKLKNGYTTGSAATAATKAALMMLVTDDEIDETIITTPSGDVYTPRVYDQSINKSKTDIVSVGDSAIAAIVKESGDDPDITASLKIFSCVRVINKKGIVIRGGDGVGIVTRPGLDQPVGEYAINSVPRKMITEVVNEILDNNDIEYGIEVTISIPEGKNIAEKTFNPHMGIEGGISVIGTTGIVKPMSTDALVETIRLDINMQYSEGKNTCVIVPGNYGVTFLKENMNIPESDIVLCSNFAGDSIKMAADIGFKNILFCSHIGKMIKISGGVLNTHSKYGDRRMEFMTDAFLEALNRNEVVKKKAGNKVQNIKNKIMECVSTTAALDVINEVDIVNEVSEVIVERSVKYLSDACNNRADIKVILYENKYGELARSF